MDFALDNGTHTPQADLASVRTAVRVLSTFICERSGAVVLRDRAVTRSFASLKTPSRSAGVLAAPRGTQLAAACGRRCACQRSRDLLREPRLPAGPGDLDDLLTAPPGDLAADERVAEERSEPVPHGGLERVGKLTS
jgi:hypothetical protein